MLHENTKTKVLYYTFRSILVNRVSLKEKLDEDSLNDSTGLKKRSLNA
jgi:hypothetical protein